MGFLSKDVHPGNFCMGRPDGPHKDVLYMIDFGSAQSINSNNTNTTVNNQRRCSNANQKRGRIIQNTGRRQRKKKVADVDDCHNDKPPRGWYHSKNVSLGNAATKKDDLESLGYTLVYLLKGHLPWYNYPQKDTGDCTDEKVNDSVRIKLQTSIAELTRDLPIEFAMYFNDLNELGTDEEPSYFTLRNRFRALAKKQDAQAFDWDIVPNAPKFNVISSDELASDPI